MKFKWELREILGLAAIPRIAAAFTSLGFDHPNEPFRTLEPMAALSGWTANPPWEWTQGLLSALPVYFHLVISAPFQENPIVALTAMKLIYAVLSLTLVAATYQVIEKLKPKSGLSLMAACGVAFWPELVFQSVRIMDYSLEAAGLAGALLLWNQENFRGKRFIGIGLIIGALFFVRPQTCLAFLPFLLGTTNRYEVVFLSLGYGASIVGFGLLESALTQVDFLAPFQNYIFYNVVRNGAARDYGSDPWHRYITEVGKYWSWFPFFIALFAFSRKSLIQQRKAWPLLGLFAIPFLVHSAISHKEGRFLYGSLWTVVPIAVLGWDSLKGFRKKWLIPLTTVGIGLAFLASIHRVSQKWTLHHQSTQAIASAGLKIRQGNYPDKSPVLIQGEPLWSPAGFLLRTHRVICHQSCAESRAEPIPVSLSAQ
ncbi:MAG: hypothetical protein JNL01_09035 [Bdellovibrionales bacterium]|nr:hypothetical protein [Bdellovibrionales bacterium]